MIKEITNFFESYKRVSEDVFKPLGNDGSDVAIKLIKSCIKKAAENSK